MDSGIYAIVHIPSGRCYIGSAKSIRRRWRRHRKDLRNGKHHSQFLLRAWRKYGEAEFAFEVLEPCSIELLEERENHYLSESRPEFNNCPRAYSQIGRKLSDDHVRRIKEYAHANNVRPPESTWKPKQRPVEMINKTTKEVINRFVSIAAACRFIGRTSEFTSTISDCCNGGRHKSYLGYEWSWA